MDFTRKTYPHFHQAAIATALTLSVLSPAAWSDECNEFPAAPLTVNITGESEDFCDDQVSLREAIHYANNYLVGKDAVTFASALKGKIIEAVDGRIEVRESISIAGIDDAELITLKASNEAPLFSIESSADRIDFDLSHVILEKQAGSNHIIEMDGYGGDIVLDDIQTTDSTRADGIFENFSNSNEAVNDLNITLKNSNISGSIFSDDILTTSNSIHGNNHIVITDSQIINTTAAAIVYSSSRNYENTASTLIQRSNITGNTVDIIAHSYSYESAANISVSESTISGNTVDRIATSSSYHSGNIDIAQSTISGNIITHDGFTTSTNSIMNIQDSILCDNLDADLNGYGGDYLGKNSLINIYRDTNLNISNSELCNNQQRAVEIYSQIGSHATATIENTIILNNSNEEDGAGIYAYADNQSKLDLNIISSSISGNKNKEHGGGISVEARDESEINLKIHNSTISGNQAGYSLSGENETEGTGGGIRTYSDSDSAISVDITNSTISHNVSSGSGGGIASFNTRIYNSIIANNVAGNDTDQDLIGSFIINNSLIEGLSTINLTSINGTFIHNIGSGEGQTPDTGNNILGQNPLLQDLSLSGGTWVQQLSADSPAIGAGNADSENLPVFDQRGEGFARVRDANGNPVLDMGAVQYFTKPVAVNDAISVEQDSENNSINVLANDAQNSDGLPLDVGSVTIMTHPDNGNADVAADGSITYTPNAEFFGSDRLIYLVQDIDGNTSSEAVVNITVEEVIDTIPEGRIIESSSGGGSLNLWLLSLFGLLGLRRKKS